MSKIQAPASLPSRRSCALASSAADDPNVVHTTDCSDFGLLMRNYLPFLLPLLALRAWADAAVCLNNYDANQPIAYLVGGTFALPAGVQVEIWSGPVNGALKPVANGSGLSRFNLSEAGYFDGGIGVIAGLPDKSLAQFQIRAWKEGVTFDAAAYRGASAVFTQTTGSNPPLPLLPAPVPLQIPSAIVLTSNVPLVSAPIIEVQPSSLAALVGCDVAFTVAARGALPLSFQWSFNGAGLLQATNGTLLLKSVQPAQSGAYVVAIKNPLGTVTSSLATLTVLSPPVISSSPQDTIAVAGAKATFQVAATGTAPLAYQWYFNGAALLNGSQAIMTLDNVQPSQTGDYFVIVSNPCGSRVSQSAHLSVLFALAALTDGLGSIHPNPDLPGYASNTIVTLGAVPSGGSIFAGWTGDITGTKNPVSLTMDGSKTVTAHFSSSWVLTTPSAVGGTIVRQPDAGRYPGGTTVTLTALPATNYVFTGWSGDATGTSNPLSITLRTNQLVAASFKRLFSVSTSQTGQGAVILSPAQNRYVEGSAVFVSALSGAGYRFTGWSGDLGGTSNPATLVIDGNKNISATFAIARTVVTIPSPGGLIQRTPDLSGYLDGDKVQLTARPDPGFVFTGWSGDANGTNNPLVLTVQASRSITAQFADRQPPTITLSTPVPGDTTNSAVTLSGTVTDNAGVSSVRWERNGLPQGNLTLNNGVFALSTVRLFRGLNKFRVLAQDTAENQSTAEVLVNYLAGSGQPSGPTLTGMMPASAPAGTTVTLLGSNFDPVPANNLVFFGATKASVLDATPDTLKVIAPPCATYASITVTTPDGCRAATPSAFLPSFTPAVTLDTFSFSSKIDFSVGSSPRGLAVGDLNLDAKPDLVVANYDTAAISLAQNLCSPHVLAAGSLGAPVAFPAGLNPSSLAIADLDGDGELDVVVVNESSDSVSVFRNTGSTGQLNSGIPPLPVSFPTGSHPYALAIADLDGDGKPDLIVANQLGASISILRNTSRPGQLDTNSFAPRVDFPLSGIPTSLAVGDLDGDGQPDVAVGVAGAAVLSVFRNTSQIGCLDTNSFAARLDFPLTGEPRAATIADLDGDGKLDIIIANGSGSTITILPNTSIPGQLDAHSFSAPVTFPTGQLPRAIAIGDLNGDAKPDLVVANYGDSTVSVLANRSLPGRLDAGAFAPRIDYSAGPQPRGLAVVDMDGDDRPDIVIINGGSGVSILPNSAQAVQPVFVSTAITRPTTSGFGLTLLGKKGVSCRIEASEDLQTWAAILNVTNVTGLIQCADPAAAFHAHRFYRAVAE
jgi:uncharacterized repeat protein (TIGR02543 family)